MWEPCTHSLRTKAPSETITPGRANPSGWAASVGRCTGQALGCDSRVGRYGAGVAVECRQALAQIAHDALRLEAARLLRIQGVWVGSAAAHQDGRMRRGAGACGPLIVRAAAAAAG